MDGEKKYSPPLGTTKSWSGSVMFVVGSLGLVPLICLIPPPTFCPMIASKPGTTPSRGGMGPAEVTALTGKFGALAQAKNKPPVNRVVKLW